MSPSRGASHLPRRFARKMLPLAIAAGIACAAAPPIFHEVVARPALASHGQLVAEAIARDVGRLAARQPSLWRYNVPKLVRTLAPYERETPISSLRIVDCQRRSLFAEADLPLGSGDDAAVEVSAPLSALGTPIGAIDLGLDDAAVVRTRWRILAVSGPLGVLLALLLFRLPMRTLRVQSSELAHSLADLSKAEARLSAASIQEAERRRIGRDLHDGVGQQLTALRLELQRLERAPARGSLSTAETLVESALGELRRAVRDLYPPALEAGLARAIAEASEAFEQRSGIPASFKEGSGGVALAPDQASALYRVLQEALTNVSRHAQAGEVGISLTRDAERVTLEIADDGRGFDVTAPTGGSGLLGMRERVALIGGTLAVESAPGAGTRVRASVPLRPAG